MTNDKKGYLVPMLIIGALFFIFGFVTWVNGTLIPYLKIACQLAGDVVPVKVNIPETVVVT